MKIAIMQPYFFPYYGYFEMVGKVDLFVFYTDVQYIQRGWVNRNRIRSREGWQYLTVPIQHASLTTPIYKIQTVGDFVTKHLRTLETTYGQKRCRSHPLVQMYEQVARSTTPSLCELLKQTIEKTSQFLNFPTCFTDSRSLNGAGSYQDRVIDLCKKTGANHLINSPGTLHMYRAEDFAAEGIKLEVLELTDFPNKLSILDVILGDELKCIVYASRHGHSSRVAQDIGWKHIFNAKDKPDLSCFGTILFVCPTYGDAELHPAMEDYLLTLGGKKQYVVCELGHYHGYEKTNFGAAAIIEKHLDALGWRKIAPLLSLDSQPHIRWDKLHAWKECLKN